MNIKGMQRIEFENASGSIEIDVNGNAKLELNFNVETKKDAPKQSAVRFFPKEKERFYYYSLFDEMADCSYFTMLNERCLENLYIGNCFRTEDEALQYGRQILERIQEQYKNDMTAPAEKQSFWYYSLFQKGAVSTVFTKYNERDLENYVIGNCFASKDEAEVNGKIVLDNLKAKILRGERY